MIEVDNNEYRFKNPTDIKCLYTGYTARNIVWISKPFFKKGVFGNIDGGIAYFQVELDRDKYPTYLFIYLYKHHKQRQLISGRKKSLNYLIKKTKKALDPYYI